MNKAIHSTGSASSPALSRRGFLGAAVATSVPAVAVSAAAESTAAFSIEDFLAKASNAEKAWYHANSLAEIMNQMHPDHFFVSHVHHDLRLSMVIGHKREVRL